MEIPQLSNMYIYQHDRYHICTFLGEKTKQRNKGFTAYYFRKNKLLLVFLLAINIGIMTQTRSIGSIGFFDFAVEMCDPGLFRSLAPPGLSISQQRMLNHINLITHSPSHKNLDLGTLSINQSSTKYSPMEQRSSHSRRDERERERERERIKKPGRLWYFAIEL